jgi:hypothetical protein
LTITLTEKTLTSLYAKDAAKQSLGSGKRKMTQSNIPKKCPNGCGAGKKEWRAVREGNSFNGACSRCGYVHKARIEITEVNEN